MGERFPDISCPRSHEFAQLYTCPLAIFPPTDEERWQALCGDCFRQVLETERSDDLLMVPIRHGWR